MKIKRMIKEMIREHKKKKETDKLYRLLSKFGFDGFDEHPPSFYENMNSDRREERNEKELDSLRKIRDQMEEQQAKRQHL